MSNFSEKERIEISRILESLKGRLDKRLIKLTMDLVMNTKWSQENEKELYKRNIDQIPKKSLEGRTRQASFRVRRTSRRR